MQLRAENAVVTDFDEELRTTAKEMLIVMYASAGIGLAAPQVGVNKRLMVFNEKAGTTRSTAFLEEYEKILINPVITGASTKKVLGDEGCLSFPQIYGKVSRHIWVELDYHNLVGEKLSTRFVGKPAIIFQHEYDHLDKVLFIDRLQPKDLEANKRLLERHIKKYGPGGAL